MSAPSRSQVLIFSSPHTSSTTTYFQTEKTRMLLEQTHTGGSDSTGDNNVFEAQFQAVVLDSVPDPLIDGGKYYISAGVEYGNGAYVWVGQAEIQTALTGHVSCLKSQ